MQTPSMIAFDVIETLFPIEPLRSRIVDIGQPPHLLELWFTRLLRDGFALSATGSYRPFAEVAGAALASVTQHAATPEQTAHLLAGFAELDPHPDVEPAMRRARDADVRVITLTNGAAATTEGLLARAGLDQYVERTISIDEVAAWKPAAAVYRHAAANCGVAPEHTGLVAAHAWDTHGARRAGLVTGWVSRLEREWPAIYDPPDVTGEDLVAVVDGLLARPGVPPTRRS